MGATNPDDVTGRDGSESGEFLGPAEGANVLGDLDPWTRRGERMRNLFLVVSSSGWSVRLLRTRGGSGGWWDWIEWNRLVKSGGDYV